MARINKLSGASKSPGQVAQDLRCLLDDRAQPFECVVRLLTERSSVTVAAVCPSGIRVADDRATAALLFFPRHGLGLLTGYALK